jgi:hypothetical protein
MTSSKPLDYTCASSPFIYNPADQVILEGDNSVKTFSEIISMMPPYEL